MSRAADLRVCIYVTPYPPAFGGHGIQMQRLLPTLSKQGVAPTILTRRLRRLDRPLRAGDPGAASLAPVHRDLSEGTGALPSVARAAQLRRHMSRHASHYDVFHAAQIGWDMLLSLSYLKRRGIPVVIEMVLLGGDDPISIAESRLGRRKLEILRQVDAWVGITQAFRGAMLAAGIPEERFHVIYTGVDLDVYRPHVGDERRALRERLGLPPDGRIAVSVGSVIPRKGMDRCLRAWARTRPQAGRDVLLIAGPNRVDDGLLEEAGDHAEALAKEAETPELAGTVRFLGRRDDVHDYMAASDLFLFLSRMEGLGTVILEALACGLPCIVSPLDGIADELLGTSPAGWIARDPDDAEGVARELERLLDDPALRAERGAAGRRLAEERFSLERRAEALARVYRGVLEPGPEGR